jgi:hypothetical protein
VNGGPDFERFCTVAYRFDFHDPNISFVGTNGVSQGGLDILGFRHFDRKTVGVQSKNYRAKPSIALVRKCIKAVEKGIFRDKIKHLIITVAKTPTIEVLSEVTQLSNDRNNNGQFTVHLEHFDNLRLRILPIDLTQIELMFPELFDRKRETYDGRRADIENVKLRQLFNDLERSSKSHTDERLPPTIQKFIERLCARSPRELVAPNGVKYIDMPDTSDFVSKVIRVLDELHDEGGEDSLDTYELEFDTHKLANYEANDSDDGPSVEAYERRSKLHVHIPFLSYSARDVRLRAYVGNYSDRFPLCRRTFWIDDVDLQFSRPEFKRRFISLAMEGDPDTLLASTAGLYAKLGIYDHLFRTIFPALTREGIFRVHFNLHHDCDETRDALRKHGFTEIKRGFPSVWINDTLRC